MLAVLLVFSVFVGAAMIAAGLLVEAVAGQRGKPIAARSRVVEGEYRVVRKPVLPLSR